ncbi:hypothetical protein BGW42_000426 [Actinomortierella wolfii]|nr:hypothetical protein BGW42_000426 [Actinomortierella wolfii]
MLSKPHPLDIPELRFLIGRHLDLDGRRACALVCKAWHADMQPLVWETFSIYNPVEHVYGWEIPDPGQEMAKDIAEETSDKEEKERLLTISKYAHFIRHFSRIDENDVDMPLVPRIMRVLLRHCRSLLTIDAVVSPMNSRDWDQCKRLIQMNPGLRKIRLQSSLGAEMFGLRVSDHNLHSPFVHRPRGGGGGTDGVARWSHLRRLEIGCNTNLFSLVKILDICPGLKELVIYGDLVPVDVEEFPMPGTPLEEEEEEETEEEEEEGEDENNESSDNEASEGNHFSAMHDTWMEIQAGHDNDYTDGGEGILPWRTRHRQFGLKKLHLGYSCTCPELGAFLRLCPELDALGLCYVDEEATIPLCRAISNGQLPHVTSLTLGPCTDDPGLHRVILEAFKSHQLAKLDIAEVSENDIQRLLEYQRQSLEVLSVELTDEIEDSEDEENNGGMVSSSNLTAENPFLDILTSCTRLHRLVIQRSDSEAIDPHFIIAKPWACTELEFLALPLSLSQTCKDSIRHRLPLVEVKDKPDFVFRHIDDFDEEPPPPTEKSTHGQDQVLNEEEEMFLQRLEQLPKLRTLNVHVD